MNRASDALPRSCVATPGPFARALSRLWTWLRARHRNRSGIRDLEALDDHMLHDIGLTRSEVEHAVHFGRPLGNEVGRTANQGHRAQSARALD